MYTTITVNGPDGSRFLASLEPGFLGGFPPALASLVRDGAPYGSVLVETDLAEQVAVFLERVIANGTVPDPRAEPPLLFSPNIGDAVAIVRDVLVEFQPPRRRGPRIWRFLARGTRGRMISDHGKRELGRILVDESGEIAFVHARNMTGVRFWSTAARQ